MALSHHHSHNSSSTSRTRNLYLLSHITSLFLYHCVWLDEVPVLSCVFVRQYLLAAAAAVRFWLPSRSENPVDLGERSCIGRRVITS